MSSKSFLIVSRRAPYASNHAREALDAALTAAIFEQDVAMLFLSDGVYQLLNNQQPGTIGQKNLGANLQVLPMYDIEKLYVSKRALDERSLTTDQLVVPVQALDDAEINTLIKQQDLVLNF